MKFPGTPQEAGAVEFPRREAVLEAKWNERGVRLKRSGLLLLVAVAVSSALLFPLCVRAAEDAVPVPEVPFPGVVTMVDLGADKCIPCKMMAPILKELQEDYKGRAAVVFIDVWKHPEQAPKFHVRAIPTQIFFDKDGKEFHRHEGFLDRGSITSLLEQAGVKRPDPKD